MSIEKSISEQLPVSSFSGMISEGVSCYSSNGTIFVKVPELTNDIEEADTHIIPHALHAVKIGLSKIVILPSDADVLVLLMYYWDILHSNSLSELWMKAGIADSTTYIPIHILTFRVGADLCHVFPTVHTLTGCDYTSKFGTESAALKVNSCI